MKVGAGLLNPISEWSPVLNWDVEIQGSNPSFPAWYGVGTCTSTLLPSKCVLYNGMHGLLRWINISTFGKVVPLWPNNQIFSTERVSTVIHPDDYSIHLGFLGSSLWFNEYLIIYMKCNSFNRNYSRVCFSLAVRAFTWKVGDQNSSFTPHQTKHEEEELDLQIQGPPHFTSFSPLLFHEK